MTQKNIVFWEFILLIAKIYLGGVTSSVDKNQCYNPNNDFYPYLASRTPYSYIHGNIVRPPECTPLQIWMTARHGTRYPSIPEQELLDLEKLRDQIILNHKQKRGELCFNDLKKLQLWQPNPNFYNHNKNKLAPEGKRELYSMAQRLKKIFPELMQRNEPSNYKFLTTHYERSNSSLISFANALIGMNKSIEFEDDEMKAGRNCPWYTKNLRWDELMKEHDKFIDGSVMYETLKNISIRLGLLENIEYDKLFLAYNVCRYETALNPNVISIWCQIFRKEELIVFEYLEDLDYYHVNGPGNKIIKELTCGLIKKLFESFKELEIGTNANQPKGIFNIGHSTNVQSLLTLLKVYDSEGPLLASNFNFDGDRLYRISKMGSFATNIIAIFYRCNGTESPNKVMFHVAEHEISIPGCEGGFCNWDYLKREFHPIIEQCDLNLCDIQHHYTTADASNSFSNGYIIYFLFLIFEILIHKYNF